MHGPSLQIGAATRVRNACAFATHKFFNDRGFLYIHTPIVTTSDCEGAGEMFQVTTMLPPDAKVSKRTLCLCTSPVPPQHHCGWWDVADATRFLVMYPM